MPTYNNNLLLYSDLFDCYVGQDLYSNIEAFHQEMSVDLLDDDCTEPSSVYPDRHSWS